MNRKAIILVAGMGTRLKPLTLQNHKCLTEVNGIPILENALENLSAVGVSQVVLVVGYLKDQIRDRIGNYFANMSIVYAENDIFDQTNTVYSLQIGLEALTDYDELLLLEGDVFFHKVILDDLISIDASNATVLEPYNDMLDGTFAELNQKGYVVDWTHKSMRSEDYTVSDKYKTVNIHKFSYTFIQNYLCPEIKAIEEERGIKQPLENVMQIIVQNDSDLVKGLVLNGQKWFEIDDQHDLAIAERIFSQTIENRV